MKIALLTGMLVTVMAASSAASDSKDGHDDGHAGGCSSYCPYTSAGDFDPEHIGNKKTNATCQKFADRKFEIAKTKVTNLGTSLIDECISASNDIFDAGCCNKNVYPCEICPEGFIEAAMDDITFNTSVGDKRTCAEAIEEFNDGLYIRESTCKGKNAYLVCAGCCVAPEKSDLEHSGGYGGGYEDEETAYGYDHHDHHDDHGDDSHADHDAHSDDTHSDDTHSDDTHSDDTHSGDTHSGDTHSGDTHSDDTHSDDTHSDDTHSGDTHSGDTHSGDTHSVNDTHTEETHEDDGHRRRMAASGGNDDSTYDSGPSECTNRWEGGNKNYETGKCSCKFALSNYNYDEEAGAFTAAPVLLSALLPAVLYMF